MKSKLFKISINCILVCLVVVFASSCTVNQTSTSGDTLTIAYSGVDSLNPLIAQTWAEHSIMYLTQAQLVRFFDKNIELDAAESFKTNENYTKYTFKIKKGLTWENGNELNAEDFVYGMYCTLAPQFASPRAGGWEIIKNAKAFSSGEITDWNEVGIKAVDEYTLEFNLEYPDTSFEKTIASKHLYPIEKSFFEKINDSQTFGTSMETILSSGAYTVSDMIFDEKIVLEKNKDYWNAKNSFPTANICLLEVADSNTQVAMFKNGEIDIIAGVDGQYNKELIENSYEVIGGGFQFLWFNQNGKTDETSKLLSNINFRKALSYALNRNDIAVVSNTANQPANFIIDPSFTSANGKPFYLEYPVDTVPLEGNSEMANNYLKTALSELGYSSVDELPKIRLVTFAFDSFKNECETMMNQWKNVLGIDNIQLLQYEPSVAIGTFYSLDYDIFCITWETNTKPTDIMQSLMNGGEANVGLWDNDEFEVAVKNAINETDPIKQEKMIQNAEQIFINDCGITPLYVEGWIHAVQDYVEGYRVGNGGDGFEFQQLVINK